MGIEELQLEATKLEARELELEAALKETHDLRMLALGVIRGYNLRQMEDLDTRHRELDKRQQELEANKQKE